MNTIQISVIKVYVTSCMRYKLLLALQTIGHYINADMRQDQGPIMSLPLESVGNWSLCICYKFTHRQQSM